MPGKSCRSNRNKRRNTRKVQNAGVRRQGARRRRNCPQNSWNQETQNIFVRAHEILLESYDHLYRRDIHLSGHNTCDMWIWKEGETYGEEEGDTHLHVIRDNTVRFRVVVTLDQC